MQHSWQAIMLSAFILQGLKMPGHISIICSDSVQALLLSHPRKLIRDTARYPPLMRATAPGRRPKPRALRHLAAQHLALAIQAGEHSPVDDARAALYLYLRFQKVHPLRVLLFYQSRGLERLCSPHQVYNSPTSIIIVRLLIW